MTRKESILQGALELSPTDRLEIAEQLFESVEGEAGAEQAWAEEIARRVEAIDSGKVELMSWEEARKRIVG
jgi:putative addiction module component (TIGR02574 family)